MRPIAQPEDASASQLPTPPAPMQRSLRSKRRPKPSARYRSYIQQGDSAMSDSHPSSDDATVSHPNNQHRSTRKKFIDNDQHLLNQSSDVQTTAPSSPYDADEEDEGERDDPTAVNLRKRTKRSLSRPPVKQSRGVTGRRTSRRHSSNLVGEPGNPSSVENSDINDCPEKLSSSREGSQSGLDIGCDGPACISHAEPDVPGIMLWDDHNRVLVPDKLPPSRLAHVLRNNKAYAIYVGQDEKHIKYPGDLLNLTKPVNQEPWMNELRKPPAQRKVMIIDPKSAKLLAPRNCPNLDNLSRYLEDLGKGRSREGRRRVFNAHFTDSHGFTLEQWKSIFSLPPPVSNKTANNTAPDPVEPPGTLQPPPQEACALPPPPPLHSHPSRALRQLKNVRYKEESSDIASFQSSQSDRSDVEAPQISKEMLPPKPPHSSSRLSSSPASSSEDFDSQFDSDECDGRERRGMIYQDIFPASSSEYERTEAPDISSPYSSSDESVEAKEVHVPTSPADRKSGDTTTVSPSSVVVLNRTPTFTLQKLYSFQDSSASEDSLSEALGRNCFDDVQSLGNVNSSETPPPSHGNLKLQLQNRPEGDAQTLADMHQFGQRNGADSLSLHLHIGEANPSTNSNAQHKSEVPIEGEGTDAKNGQRPEFEARCENAAVLNVLPRTRRRVREISSSCRESGKCQQKFEVAGRNGSLDVRLKQDSNDVSTGRSWRNSIRNKKRVGTNEKLGSNPLKHSPKNGERNEDDATGSFHDSGTSVSAPAHVVPVRSKDSALCQSSHPKDSSCASVIRRRRSASPNTLQSNEGHERKDLKTSHAEELGFPTIHAKRSEAVSTSAEPTSEEVYLWDYESKTKSDTPLSLARALELSEANDLTMIYDGQDIKTGDPRFGEIWSDTKAWISRKGTRPAFRRKVRVWDHCTGKLERFCFSPSMCEVQQWLKNNPDNTLFKPSLCAQYEHPRPVEGANSTACSVQSRVKRAIQNQVLNRIEHLGITQLSEGLQREVVLWNVLKRKCEPPRDFASRSNLTRFLFSNPALELLRGQDEVLRLERRTELKLIRITRECPAECISFWDTQLRITCLRPKESETSQGKTVQQRIDLEPGLEVYVGQDLQETEKVRDMIAFNKCSVAFGKRSLSNSLYTLARCGKHLQTHVYSKGWVPKYIETKNESVFHATFWSKSQKALRMESLNDPRLSIEEYLKASPDLELYTGQDMPVNVQEELHRWFHLLSYETGTDVERASPMLLRYSLIPLKYRAIRFTSGDEFRIPRKPFKRQRRRRREASAEGNEDEISNREKGTVAKRQRLSLRVNKRSDDERNHHASISSLSDEDEILDNGRALETQMTRADSQDATNYEEENLDGSSRRDCTATPSSSTLDERYAESQSEDDAAVCTEGDASLAFPEHLPDVENHVRSATKSAKKMICIIREAGPKVLKRELMHDVRQNLREQLILEVESVMHLMALVKDFSGYDFASVANELCEELQLLDVHGCFSCSADLGYTANDLSSIREDLQGGRICTSHGVIKRFREVCAGLTQFHEGTLLQGQAALLRFYGEEVIAKFQKSHGLHLEKEQQMLRVFRICERAKHIGFRTGQRNRKSKLTSNLLSLGSSERSLRVSGPQPEVTFLNYRDEKGNSVMGKRPSVRVFGFTIDTNALEDKIGNIAPCHICRTNVVLSRADSMRCSNRIFGICEEVVCRECLETVFSLELDEFKVLRDSENWFCVHCRGLCPSGSACSKTVVSSRLCSAETETRLRFTWPYAPNDAKSVIAVISKRHWNGEYDPFPENLPEDKFDLVHDPLGKNWFTFMDLRVGGYRCQLMVDNVWVASTTFHVMSSPADSDSAYKQEKPRKVPETSVSYLRGPHRFAADAPEKLAARVRPRGPRIRWYPIPKGPAHAVHAIRDSSAQDGGTLVKECSRTEGYDWRRAKRHATLQWIPELLSGDECQGTKREDPKQIMLCAIDSERAHLVTVDNPPIPCPGTSHQDFLVTLNTFRYNQMLTSLWSIVTGRSHIHGIGLFTLSGYKKGDFVIEYAGDLIRTPLADIREARYDAAGLGTYLFKINEDQIVDATVQSNRARFTNHSCDPNMVADIVHVQGRDLIVLRATREIPRFTELTFDYKFPYEEAKVQCLCNSWNCVGVMN